MPWAFLLTAFRSCEEYRGVEARVGSLRDFENPVNSLDANKLLGMSLRTVRRRCG
jgi:hypothetical protein